MSDAEGLERDLGSGRLVAPSPHVPNLVDLANAVAALAGGADRTAGGGRRDGGRHDRTGRPPRRGRRGRARDVGGRVPAGRRLPAPPPGGDVAHDLPLDDRRRPHVARHRRMAQPPRRARLVHLHPRDQRRVDDHPVRQVGGRGPALRPGAGRRPGVSGAEHRLVGAKAGPDVAALGDRRQRLLKVRRRPGVPGRLRRPRRGGGPHRLRGARRARSDADPPLRPGRRPVGPRERL